MKTFLKYQCGQVNQVCNLMKSFYIHVNIVLPIDTSASDTPELDTISTSTNQS